MFIAGLVKMLPASKTTESTGAATALARIARKTFQIPDETNCYDYLIHSIFRPEDQNEQAGKVIAFTGASAGAGTSSVLKEIGDELACYEARRTLIVEAKKLQTATKVELEAWLRSVAAKDTNISSLKAEEDNRLKKVPAALSKTQRRVLAKRSRAISPEDNLRLLRAHFDYVMVDCQPAKSSSEVIVLTKLVDGVVIVAEAGRTRRDEIQRSQQVVEIAEGKILGFVLNKREYPVPGWLYNII